MQAVAKKKKPANAFNAEKLTALRTELKLSQAQLAKKAGVNAMDVSRYERGLVVPSFDVACRLADALGVGVEQLREGARG